MLGQVRYRPFPGSTVKRPNALALVPLLLSLTALAQQRPPTTPAKPLAPLPSAAAAPTTTATPPPPPAPRGGPCHSLITVIETLYQKQLFEAADVVLGLALNSPDATDTDKVALHVLEGILRMEAFQEPQASKAFSEALNEDREARLPDFAPPRTRRLFEDIKATLPPVPAKSASAVAKKMDPTKPITSKKAPPPKPGPYDQVLPWIPIGVGGAAVATGAGFLVATRLVDGQLRSGSPDITTPELLQSAVSRGNTYQTTGIVLAGAGGAILIGGLVWRFGPDFMPLFSMNVVPSEQGFAAVVSGSLP